MTTLLVLAMLLVVALVLRLVDRVLKLHAQHDERLTRLENGGPLPPPLLGADLAVPHQRPAERTEVLPVVPASDQHP